MKEKPNAPEFSSGLTYSEYSEATLISPVVTYFHPRFEASLSYLDITGGDSLGKGPKVDQVGQVLPRRFDYRNAYRLDMKADLYAQKIQRIFGRLKVINGATEDYSLIGFGLDYRMTKVWMATLDQIMIRSGDASKDSSLFQEYASNDSLTLGVSYVF